MKAGRAPLPTPLPTPRLAHAIAHTIAHALPTSLLQAGEDSTFVTIELIRSRISDPMPRLTTRSLASSLLAGQWGGVGDGAKPAAWRRSPMAIPPSARIPAPQRIPNPSLASRYWIL